ncbi:MAG: S8 family serine peptidase [Bacteroidota bacterium]
MKHLLFIMLTASICFGIKAQASRQYAPDQLILQFKAAAAVNLESGLTHQRFQHAALDALNARYGMEKVTLTGNRKIGNTFVFHYAEPQVIEALVTSYQNTDLFEYVEPNYIGQQGGESGTLTFPDDALFSRQWGLYNDGSFSLSPSTSGADIDMDLAWDIETGSSSVVIAVLDGGMRMNHPDINDRIWVNATETENGTDDDGNDFVDDLKGWDFVNDDNDPNDDNGHGTNVGGIIGTEANNGTGYAGIDWNARIMICKITDDQGFGFYSWWSDAIYYAVDNGANVINMSVGGSGNSALLRNAVNYAYNQGVTVVACMMNTDNNVPYYPATFANTIAVGATNPNDQRTTPFFWSNTSGSNYGPHIDVVAPGNFIYGLSHASSSNYNTYWGGTSQAAPLVTGLAALLLAQDGSRTPDDIRSIIQTTAEDQVGDPAEDIPGFDVYYGHGRINAHQALLQLSTNVTESDRASIRVELYPNPTQDQLFIVTERPFHQVSIQNLLGHEVYRQAATAGQLNWRVQLDEVPAGVYVVIGADEAGKTIWSSKVMKK